jgi:hypothetical protein
MRIYFLNQQMQQIFGDTIWIIYRSMYYIHLCDDIKNVYI